MVFRDFLKIPNEWILPSETFFRYQFFPIPVPIPPKKLKIPGTSTSHFVIYTLRAHPGHSQRIFREHSCYHFFPKISNIAIFGIFCATKETVRGSKLMGCSFLAPTHPHISATLIRTCLNFVLSAYAWSQKQNRNQSVGFANSSSETGKQILMRTRKC